MKEKKFNFNCLLFKIIQIKSLNQFNKNAFKIKTR